MKLFIVLSGIVLAAAQLFAHHSFAAEFDAGKRVTLKGIVTKVDWRNPHIYVYLNVKDASGFNTIASNKNWVKIFR